MLYSDLVRAESLFLFSSTLSPNVFFLLLVLAFWWTPSLTQPCAVPYSRCKSIIWAKYRVSSKPELRIRIRDPVPFWPLDPGSGMGKNQDPGSGINIPDPQHCSKQTKQILGSNRPETKFFWFKPTRNKICFGFVSVCFVKPKTKDFGLFRCFEPISK